MDFFFRQNLNRSDFLCCFQQAKPGGTWAPVVLGYPTVVFDLHQAEVILNFFKLDSRRETVKQSLTHFAVSPDPQPGVLLFAHTGDGSSFALAFADPEFMGVFYNLLQKLTLRSRLIRTCSDNGSFQPFPDVPRRPDGTNPPHLHPGSPPLPNLPVRRRPPLLLDPHHSRRPPNGLHGQFPENGVLEFPGKMPDPRDGRVPLFRLRPPE